MADYQQTLDWLFTQTPMFHRVGSAAYKPGLERTLELSAAFGSPHHDLRCIHVAGTNGKGSTASLIASVLTSAGYRTGLFTSPHLVDFRERIRIDGEMIGRDEVTGFVDTFRERCPGMEPSFFELTTVMAFDYFARRGVDYAVIEVGLGGRLDSTNIIRPELSVITNISLDHTSLLGDTPAAIAAEKAGIIKAGVPVVIGRAEGDVRQVFADRAAAVGAPIEFACDEPLVSAVCRADRNEYHAAAMGDFVCELSGECQAENANTVLHALRHLPVGPDAIRTGFASVGALTGLRGRWTILRRDPVVIYDTGHNPGGWQYKCSPPRRSRCRGAAGDSARLRRRQGHRRHTRDVAALCVVSLRHPVDSARSRQPRAARDGPCGRSRRYCLSRRGRGLCCRPRHRPHDICRRL